MKKGKKNTATRSGKVEDYFNRLRYKTAEESNRLIEQNIIDQNDQVLQELKNQFPEVTDRG